MTTMDTELDEVRLVSKGPCPQCGSRDNLATYSDSHQHCFGAGCGYHVHGDTPLTTDEDDAPSSNRSGFVTGAPQSLSARRLSAETCSK